MPDTVDENKNLNMSPSIPTTARAWSMPAPAGTIADLAIKEVTVPSPKSDEVLVKVHATSLNYRDPFAVTIDYGVTVGDTLIPCSDMAGEIVAVGSAATKFRVGDRVSANVAYKFISGDPTRDIMPFLLGGPYDGTLTEYIALPEESIVTIPEHLSYIEASTLPGAGATAYQSLFNSVPVKAGDTVLVQGTGGVSLYALQFAAAAGAVVISTSSTDEKLEFTKKHGATHGINYVTTPHWGAKATELTNGRGVDHIVNVGGAGTLLESTDAVRLGGHIHGAGILTPGDIGILPVKLMMTSATLHGIGIASRTDFENTNAFVSKHKIKPIIDNVFSFEQAKEAFEHFAAQKHVGKVVIQIVQ